MAARGSISPFVTCHVLSIFAAKKHLAANKLNLEFTMCSILLRKRNRKRTKC